MTSADPQAGSSPLAGRSGGPPFVWAHRGASALAPENSLEAFLLAADLGAEGVELDVQLSADGVPVVVHDANLWSNGTTVALRAPGGEAGPAVGGAAGPAAGEARHAGAPASWRRLAVAELAWSELALLEVVHQGGRSAPLARLEQVLESLPDRVWIDVELKAGAHYDPRLSGVVVECLRRRPERVLVSSFDHLALREVALAAPHLPLSALCDARLVDPRQVLAAIPAPMIALRRAWLAPGDVDRWRELGCEVNVYGTEILLDLEEVLGWAAASIFLDDPRLAGPAARRGAAPAGGQAGQGAAPSGPPDPAVR